jgi:hypothetical protein
VAGRGGEWIALGKRPAIGAWWNICIASLPTVYALSGALGATSCAPHVGLPVVGRLTRHLSDGLQRILKQNPFTREDVGQCDHLSIDRRRTPLL